MKRCNIDDHWLDIAPGLLCVQRKADVPWTLSEIRDACRNEQAFLFVAHEGFVIVRPESAAGIPRLFVWAAYGLGGGLIAKYQPFIEHLARDMGARSIRFHSTRRGYERLQGWKREGNYYERIL